jgi:hypothetical protein
MFASLYIIYTYCATSCWDTAHLVTYFSKLQAGSETFLRAASPLLTYSAVWSASGLFWPHVRLSLRLNMAKIIDMPSSYTQVQHS